MTLDDRNVYVSLTREAYWVLRVWMQEGRLQLVAYDNLEVPNAVDRHLVKLLGFRDVYDLLRNHTEETKQALEMLHEDNPNAWFYYKVLEARNMVDGAP